MKYVLPFLLIVAIYSEINFPGTTKPFREIEVAVPEAGIIYKINAKEGDLVRRGQIIAYLDATLLRSSLKIAMARFKSKGNINAAQTTLKLARKKLQKILQLQQQNHIRAEEVEKAQAEVDLATARLLSAKEAQRIHYYEVQRIKTQIERHIVRAPATGIIREFLKEKGESISPAQPLCTLVQLDPIKIIAYPSFEETQQLKVKQQVQVTTSYNKKTYSGRVSFIDPVTDAASNTVKVIITIDNKNQSLKTGVICTINTQSKP
ncbi:efflux RND transporter periplasmic adaptor subunit [Candidatus Uabimicrobium amorphum]|uniref:Hemolysin D n=1 Tax=Uabimicrobium amorphum TaxID=2596890 RepID=A0A5S9IPG1_UABAM|nr:efflux RND transporter periplasmic adaptor subunit [Candidatus Uabimicrobium amorphum]BBM85277.1 hemolysin D [Candidatus Uabimicrobium amorphum]